ncbi:MAG: PA2778 family cysteine peptidase, partial [Burkholderiaceae bacterium]
VTPEPLVSQVYLPSRKGTLQVEMLAAARRHGRVAYTLEPAFGDLLREVAAGNPVLVLQDIGVVTTQWHYAVVYGYDYPSGTIRLRSGTEPERAMPFTAFERSWLKGGYWAMVATPPGRLPATATEAGWARAAVAMERSGNGAAAAVAYATAVRQWPGNITAAIGLANRHHGQGRLADAEAVLRGALERSPESTIVLNNLAQVVSDQGRQEEALALVEKASDPMGPFAGEVRETRKTILERRDAAAARGSRAASALPPRK